MVLPNEIAHTSKHIDSEAYCSTFSALNEAVFKLYSFDDLLIIDEVDFGFFSAVYKVIDLSTGHVLGLKYNTSNNYNMIKEIELMKKLSHPNILKFVGALVYYGKLHALTEFIKDGCLEKLLSNKEIKLSWSNRIVISLDISNGMKYLHENKYMHRDLSSKNILIKMNENSEYKAIIADFGLSTKIPSPESNKILSIAGSPYWMAPECLQGLKYNEKADVFSFGIVLCEIIARVSADPDILPRTKNFGLDEVAFSKMIDGCPLEFYHIALKCCEIDSLKRPSFVETYKYLKNIKKLIGGLLSPTTNILNICSNEIASILNKPSLQHLGSENYENLANNSASYIINMQTKSMIPFNLKNQNNCKLSPIIKVIKVNDSEDNHIPQKNNPFIDKFSSCKLYGSLDNYSLKDEIPKILEKQKFKMYSTTTLKRRNSLSDSIFNKVNKNNLNVFSKRCVNSDSDFLQSNLTALKLTGHLNKTDINKNLLGKQYNVSLCQFFSHSDLWYTSNSFDQSIKNLSSRKFDGSLESMKSSLEENDSGYILSPQSLSIASTDSTDYNCFKHHSISTLPLLYLERVSCLIKKWENCTKPGDTLMVQPYQSATHKNSGLLTFKKAENFSKIKK